MISSLQMHICDVCRLLDYDTTKKLSGYCKLCDAWICQKDESNWIRRLKAAAKRKLEYSYRGLPNYEEVALGGQASERETNS